MEARPCFAAAYGDGSAMMQTNLDSLRSGPQSENEIPYVADEDGDAPKFNMKQNVFIGDGEDLLVSWLTVADAQKICSLYRNCVGFTFEGHSPNTKTPQYNERKLMYLKSGGTTGNGPW